MNLSGSGRNEKKEVLNISELQMQFVSYQDTVFRGRS